MDIMRLSGGSIDFLQKTLDFRSQRHSLIASNVANMNTPNYKSSDIHFEDQMASILKAQQGNSLTRTNAKHFPVGVAGIERINPDPVLDNAPAGLDGNNVNMESEMSKLAENTIMYNAVAQIISKKLQGLKFAIESGAK